MLGKTLMVSGLVLMVAMVLYLGGVFSTGIPTPIGIAGFVYQPDGTVLTDTVTVYVENLNTSEVTSRQTQDGKFAIPISARTGDKIKVWTEYNGVEASRIITANLQIVTHWANLTIGKTESQLSPYWLFIVPLGMIGGGYYIDKRKYRPSG